MYLFKAQNQGYNANINGVEKHLKVNVCRVVDPAGSLLPHAGMVEVKAWTCTRAWVLSQAWEWMLREEEKSAHTCFCLLSP